MDHNVFHGILAGISDPIGPAVRPSSEVKNPMKTREDNVYLRELSHSDRKPADIFTLSQQV